MRSASVLDTVRRRVLLLSTASLVSVAGCVQVVEDGEPSQSERDDRLDERGTLEIVIDGTPVDLTRDRFQAEHAEDHELAFHFHEADEYWYLEGYERVTFADAIDYIPHFEYDSEDGEHVVSYDGTEYDGRDTGTEFTFSVDDEEVAPGVYEPRDGDHLHLEITTET